MTVYRMIPAQYTGTIRNNRRMKKFSVGAASRCWARVYVMKMVKALTMKNNWTP